MLQLRNHAVQFSIPLLQLESGDLITSAIANSVKENDVI